MKRIIRSMFSVLGVVSIAALLASPAFAQDTESPTDVENFLGTAYNGAVKLTWDAVTDDTGVEGYYVHYGLSTVDEAGESYDEFVDAGNVTDYLLTGLNNDTEYFLSVVAFDAEGNESLRWAEEISLTPSESAGDYADAEAPTVSEAEALNKVQVRVIFSETIVLPNEDPQDAFQIEDDDLLEPLVVTAAEMDDEDGSGSSVILTTEEQVEGTTYTLTVTSDVEDASGNPINSGTSDTAIFTGSGEEMAAVDDVAPELVDVESIDNTRIVVEFNEAIVLNIDPAENFMIVEENDVTSILTVLGVELLANSEDVEDAAVVITTSPQSEVSYVVTAVEVEDESGNEIAVAKSSGLFDGVAVADDVVDDVGDDVEAPVDASDFIAEIVEEAGKFLVTLKWVQEAQDSVQQKIYMSEDDESYDEKAELGAGAGEYDAGELAEGDHWFKLTQTDEAGNESEGVIKKVSIAETGPGVVGLVLVSLGLGRLYNRRKNRK
ncbi:MAG: hypothetical protein ABID64_01210 [Nitrospirota bacterium]